MNFLHTSLALLLLTPLLAAQGAKQDLIVFRNLERGKPLPALAVQDLDGKKVQLDLKGKTPCLLAFLRQDQEDSKAVLAMLQRLALDAKAPKTRILIIGRKGSSTKGWTLAAKTLSHRISLYVDEFGAAKTVGTVVMPSLAILDAEGQLGSSFLLYEDGLEKQIRAVIDHMLGKKSEVPGPVEARRLLVKELGSNAAGLEARGRYAEALSLREEQAGLAGEDARILAAMGRLQARLGKTATAIKTFRMSLALEDAVVVRVHLGTALFSQGSLAAARKELEAALELSPDKALVHYVLARIARQEGHLDLALSHIKKALENAKTGKKPKPAPSEEDPEEDSLEEDKDGEEVSEEADDGDK